MLDVSEYDGSYFDGKLHPMQHNAGYSIYRRWHYNDTELFADRAAGFVNKLSLSGKKVLEVGCAKGFVVEALADAGVDAYGIDVSDYCISTCDGFSGKTDAAAKIRRPDLADRFILGDIRTALASFPDNEFDALISLNFLVCIPEEDLPLLVSEMNRVSKFQAHVVNEYSDSTEGAGRFYINRTKQQWLDDFNWGKGTRILTGYDVSSALVK